MHDSHYALQARFIDVFKTLLRGRLTPAVPESFQQQIVQLAEHSFAHLNSLDESVPENSSELDDEGSPETTPVTQHFETQYSPFDPDSTIYSSQGVPGTDTTTFSLNQNELPWQARLAYLQTPSPVQVPNTGLQEDRESAHAVHNPDFVYPRTFDAFSESSTLNVSNPESGAHSHLRPPHFGMTNASSSTMPRDYSLSALDSSSKFGNDPNSHQTPAFETPTRLRNRVQGKHRADYHPGRRNNGQN
jgi:hypothetical protein